MNLLFTRLRPCALAFLTCFAGSGFANAETQTGAVVNAAAAAVPTTGGATPTITVSGKAYDVQREDTIGKIVVSHEDIERFGDANIADILKRLPGVTIGGVQGRSGEVRMRGLGSGYTQMLLDGQPVPPGFSFDAISPSSIERIEVIRAATAELSTQAVAGTINIVLRKVVTRKQYEAKLARGIQNGLPDSSLDLRLADKAGQISYSLGGNVSTGRFERPSYRSERGTDTSGASNFRRDTAISEFGTFRNAQLESRLTWSIGDGDMLSAQSFLIARKFSGGESDHYAGVQGINSLTGSDIENGSATNYTLRSSVDWTHTFDGNGKLSVKIGSNDHRRSDDNDLVSSRPLSGPLFEHWTNSDYRDKGWLTTGKYAAADMGGHILAFGWDGENNRRSEVHFDRQAGQDSAPVTEQDFDAVVSRFAVFAQDEWSASKSLSVYMGLRWEGLHTRIRGQEFAEIVNRSNVLSPILQALYKIPETKNDQVRLALARTYKVPDAYKLTPRHYIAYQNSISNPDSMGNQNLRPELALGLDATVEHYFPAGGLISVNVFLRRIDDVVVSRLVSINNRWVSTPANDGRANLHGIEMETKFPMRTWMKDAPDLDLRANLALNWSSLDSVPGPNNRLDAQTPVSANIGVDYKLSALPLKLGSAFNFQNGGPLRISATETGTSSPKRVLDLYGLWTFDAKTNVRISVSNALHQNNTVARNFVDADGEFHQITLAPTVVKMRVLLNHKF